MYRTFITLPVFFILFLFTGTVSAQQTISYQEMMDDNSYNFYEVVELAEQYFEANGRGKGSGFKPYERWKSENESLSVCVAQQLRFS